MARIRIYTDEERKERQKQAQQRYRAKTPKEKREKLNKAQAENFANVSATFKKAEAESIRAIFTAHGIKTADAIRAAAHFIKNGGTIQAGQKPIMSAEAALIDENQNQNQTSKNPL